MSAHNRLRRKWRCPECGRRLDPCRLASAKADNDRVRALGCAVPRIILRCMCCSALLYEESDHLRPLTLAEQLRFRVEDGAVADVADLTAGTGLAVGVLLP